jgi:menaquinone-specific isochorismate synthase
MDLVQEPVQAKFRLAERIQSLLGHESPGSERTIIRVAVDIDAMDPLAWLAAQPHATKVYWCGRDHNVQFAGVGVAAEEPATADAQALLQHLRSQSATDSGVRWFGGFSFAGQDDAALAVDSEWDWYRSGRFIVPRFELISEHEKYYLACNLTCSSEAVTFDDIQTALNDLDAICDLLPAPDMRLPAVESRTDPPGAKLWTETVDAALEAIQFGHLNKVVLARRTDLKLTGELSTTALLHGLREDTHHCFLFYFQPHAGTSFFGATPELLYRRNGRQLTCEAVAATRPRGESQNEDLTLGLELMQSSKDRREHQFVTDHITQALEPLCSDFEADAPTVLKLARIQHLQQHFDATLAVETTDADILGALHPTPAVGGSPRGAALAWLKEYEAFNRGAYASPFGWINHDAAEFAVAIRSALYDHGTVSLYAGAGIVEGSVAETEWAELNSKIETFRRLLGAPR